MFTKKNNSMGQKNYFKNQIHIKNIKMKNLKQINVRYTRSKF